MTTHCSPEITLLLFVCRNVKCGSMFCTGGGESISGKRASFRPQSVECKLAVDDDKSRNIDMVPRGTRCGPNKVGSPRTGVGRSLVACFGCSDMLTCVQVCLDHRCVDVSAYGLREECEKKCNNNGVRELLHVRLFQTRCFSLETQLILLFEQGVQPQERVPLQPRLGSALLQHPVQRSTPRYKSHFGEVPQPVASVLRREKLFPVEPAEGLCNSSSC